MYVISFFLPTIEIYLSLPEMPETKPVLGCRLIAPTNVSVNQFRQTPSAGLQPLHHGLPLWGVKKGGEPLTKRQEGCDQDGS